MNQLDISLIATKRGQLEYGLLVDGISLHQHFVGGTGSHPSPAFPLGAPTGSRENLAAVIQALLQKNAPLLDSGRVPLLVCDECGDVGCGALAAKITVNDDNVVWDDWAYENGYEPAREPSWPTYPASFTFCREKYASTLLALQEPA